MNCACIHKVNFANCEVRLSNFYEIECLGVNCNSQCGNCCRGNCAIGTSNFSIREQKELGLINSGVINFWSAANPWIKDKTNLPNNRFFAEKCYLGQKKAFRK